MPDADLRDLIQRYLDDSITESELRQLNAALTTDPAARRAFIKATYHARLITENLADALPASDPPVHDAPTRTPTPKPDLSPPRAKVRIAFALAAALLAACGLAAYFLVFSELPHSELPDPTSSAPLATLVDTTGTVIVDNDIAHLGDETAAGRYTIDRGSAEFQFRDGTNLRMVGRTRLTVHRRNLAFLERGRIEAVSRPGFTVAAPGGVRIKDLGTAFHVEVDDDGSVSFGVSEGAVELTLNHTAPTQPDTPPATRRFVVHAPHRVAIVDNEPRLVAALDLADVVGGGDGSGTGKDAGVRLADGKIVTTHRPAGGFPVAANTFVPAEHPYIDGVFIPDGKDGVAAIQVSSTGVFATKLPDTDGQSWDEIWNGHNVGVATTLPAFDSVIGMHCNKGITFDLNAVRNANDGLNIDRVTMTAAVGNAAKGGSIIVLIDGAERAHHVFAEPNTQQPIAIDLKPDNRFLTIIAAQGVSSGDWLFIADPTLRLTGPVSESKADTAPEQGARGGQESDPSERTQSK